MKTIADYRKERGLSQENMGKALGVGQSAVAMWETGENLPRADKLPQLAEILGCSIDELMAALQSKSEKA